MTQAACRIPTIQEPVDPVLRAIHRVRGTDLTLLEQMALLALGRLLRKGPCQLGATLVSRLLGLVEVETAPRAGSTQTPPGALPLDPGFFLSADGGKPTLEIEDLTLITAGT